ncbi:uncharacterized protein LOC135810172 [Sycon ciliatum]|uniref:uncharacterized protein LOC135810172 n=1 Tax=Sycon ciliatum TaxID=27933 RepID=UPI0031F67C58
MAQSRGVSPLTLLVAATAVLCSLFLVIVDGQTPTYGFFVERSVSSRYRNARRWFEAGRDSSWRTSGGPGGKYGLFFAQPSGAFDRGRYTAPKSGIYFVSSMLRWDSISGTQDNRIAVNGQYSTGLSAYETTSYNYNSMTITGAIYLNAGDYISLWMYSTDSDYYLQGESGFSAYYLGTLYSRFGFSGQVRASRYITSTGNQRLATTSSRFSFSSSYAWLNAPGKMFDAANARLYAPCDGIYFAAANVRLLLSSTSRSRGSYYRLMILPNGVWDINNGLHSIQDYRRNGYSFSIHASGNLYLKKGQYLEVLVHSSSDNRWRIGSESTLSVIYLTQYSAYASGFLADLANSPSMGSSFIHLNSWRTSALGAYQLNSYRAFSSGTFYASDDGYYLISANLRIDGRDSSSYQRAVVAVNGKVDVNNGMQSIRGYYYTARYFTLHISAVLYLARGDTVRLYTQSVGDTSYVQSESGFSVALVGPALPSLGFHADINTMSNLKPGWAEIKNYLTNYGYTTGLYKADSGLSNSKGQYTIQVAGVYYVAANVRIDSATVNETRVMIAKNGRTSHSRGLSAMETASGAQWAGTVSVSGFMYLDQGDYVSTFAYSPDASWTISSLSSMSVQRIGSPGPTEAFLVGLSATIPVVANKYTPVAGFSTAGGADYGLFQTTYSFSPSTGIFTASEAGYYFFTAQVRFDKAVASTTYRLVVGRVGPSPNGGGLRISRDLTATYKPASFTEAVSGTLYMTANSKVGLWVYATKPGSVISTDTTFSGSYIGIPTVATPGFQASVKTTQRMGTKSRALSVTPTYSATLGSFVSNMKFSSGYYTVPYKGTYLISANVKLSGLNVKTYYQTQLFINNADNGNNGLYSNFQAPSTTYSVTLVGTALLSKGQTLSFYTKSSDSSYQLLTESTFSAILVTNTPYQPTSYLADLLTNANIRSTSWQVVRNLLYSANRYEIQRGMHNTGLGLINSGTGLYTVKQEGYYFITTTLTFDGLGGSGLYVCISINGATNYEAGGCSYYSSPLGSSQSVHLSTIRYLTVGKTISVRYRSLSDATFTVNSVSSLGAIHLGQQRPSFTADLSASIPVKAAGVTLPGKWRVAGTDLYNRGSNVFSTTTGLFRAKYDGLYMFTANIRLDGAGSGPIEAKFIVNMQQDLQYPISYVKSGAVGKSSGHIPLTGILPLKLGDTVNLAINAISDTSYTINSQTGMSMVYVIHPSAAQGFIAQPSGSVRYSSGYRTLSSKWSTSGAYSFTSGHFDESIGRFYTTTAGLFYVMFNIRLSGLSSGSWISASVMVDGCVPGTSSACPNGLHSKMSAVQDPSQPNTLTAAGVMLLDAFTSLQIRVYCSKTCEVLKESSWTVFFAGTDSNPECSSGGPVFTSQPQDTYVQSGQSFTLNCMAHSAPDRATLQWTRGGTIIPGETSPSLTLTATTLDNTWFTCSAVVSSSQKASSRSAQVRVIGHDGEEPGFTATGGTKSYNKGFQTLRGWVPSVSPDTFQAENGVYYPPVDGIYIVTGSVYVASMSASYAEAFISVSGSSTSNNVPVATLPFTKFSSRTLSFSGAMYLVTGRPISIRVYNPTDTSWSTSAYTTFSARFVGSADEVPGVYAVSNRRSPTYAKGWTELKAYYQPAYLDKSWISGQGFKASTGRYTASCDGVYYASSNVRIIKSGSGYLRLVLAVNTGGGIDDLSGDAPPSVKMSLNAAGTFSLKKGQYISVRMYCDRCSSWYSDAADLSVVYVGPTTPSLPGFRAQKSATVKRGTGWYTVSGWSTVNPATGLYNMVGGSFNAGNGIFTASVAGTYFVSANVRVDGNCAGYTRLLIDVNNKRGTSGPQNYYTAGGQCKYNTMKAYGFVNLVAGNTVRLNMYANSDTSWTIHTESYFSVQLFDRINPGTHADLAASPAVVRTGWTEVTQWSATPSTNNGLYNSGTQFDPKTGRFTATSDGIYFASALIRLDSGNSGYFRMLLSVNNKAHLNPGISDRDSYWTSGNLYFTLSATGFINLRAGDVVSVFLYSQTDKSYRIYTESGFSVNFVGHYADVPGFLADFNPARTVSVAANQAVELTTFTTDSLSVNGFFESGGKVLTNGRFVAPVDGTYFGAANIYITPSSATSTGIFVHLALNNQYANTSLTYQARRSLPGTGTFALSVSGSFQMKQGEVISVYVGAAFTTKFTVGTESVFSAALIGSMGLAGLATAQSVAKSTTRSGVWYLSGYTDLYNYISSGAASGSYVMPQSGWYYLAFNTIVKSNASPYVRSGISIDRRADYHNGMHAIRGSPANAAVTLSGAGTARLRKGQSIQVYVYSSSDKSYTAQASLSISAISNAQIMPATTARRSSLSILRTGWTTITGYGTPNGNTYYFTSSQNVFNTGQGTFVAPFTGVYAAFGSGDFSSVSTDIFRLMVSVNSQTSSDSGMVSTHATPQTSSSFTLHVGGSLYLNAGDTVQLQVYSNTDSSYRLNFALLSVAFVSFANAAVGFNADMTSDMLVSKTVGKYVYPASWQTLPALNSSHGLYTSAGTKLVGGVYTVSETGIYIVSAQVRLDNADVGSFTIQFVLNNKPTTITGLSAIKTGSRHKNAFTQNLAGAVQLAKGSTLRIAVNADKDTSFTISSSSGMSATLVARLGTVEAVHATLAAAVSMTRTNWQSIGGWTTMTGAEPYIASKYFDSVKGQFTVQTKGYYYVSLTLRVDSITTGLVSSRIVKTGPLGTTGFMDMQRLVVSSNSMVVSGIVRLTRYDRVYPQIYSSSDRSYSVNKESSFSIVFLGGGQPQRCPLHGVRITQQPVVRQSIAIGDPAGIWIDAVSDLSLSYQWYFNNKAVPLMTKSSFNLTSAGYANNGVYKCVVTDGTVSETSANSIIDVYQTTPQWSSKNYTPRIYENVGKGTLVATVYAWVENSAHRRSAARYTISGGANKDHFSLDANSGRLTVVKSPDREAIASYSLSLLATNKANATKTATSKISITILDRNDNAPMCTRSTYTYTVVENSPKGTLVGAIAATDKDIGVNAQYRFRISNGNQKGYFALDSTNRNIIVNKPIDRETDSSILLTFVVSNVVSGPSSGCKMSITVIDVNDNTPKFVRPSSPLYRIMESEASPVGTVFGQVSATDADLGSNAQVTYSLSNVVPTTAGLFSIASRTGALFLSNTLDYDTIKQYNFTVTASDMASSPRTSSVLVQVDVQDANDNRPVFTLHNYYASLAENGAAGLSVVTVLATDKDPNPMRYSLARGGDASAFDINITTGVITTQQPLDREFRDPYVFQVVAVDGAVPAQTGSATVSVDVIDVNDNTPQFAHATYTFSISEAAAYGTALGQLLATDADDGSNGQVMYALSSSTAFTIQSSTGILELTSQLDFATQKSFSLTVTATDGGTPAKSSSAKINVTVTDSNTYPPVFTAVTYTGSVAENAAVGTTVATVSATDQDPGPAGLTYSLLFGAQSTFAIGSTTGVITLTRAVDFEAQRGYELVVHCQDSFGNDSMSSVSFVVIRVNDTDDNVPVFNPAAMALMINAQAGPGVWLMNVSATDADTGTFGTAGITYAAAAGNKYLNVTSAGIVTLGAMLPETGTVSEKINALSSSGTSQASLTVTITTVQPQSNPIFTLSQYAVSVYENIAPMSTILKPRATLPGAEGSGDLVYSLASGSPSQFTVVSTTGDLVVSGSLDAETTKTYTLTVVATYTPEGAVSALVGMTKVVVSVMDFNDNAPVFTTTSRNAVFSVTQSDPAGTRLGRVMATDADAGNNGKVIFGMISGGDGVIRIDPYTGTLYTSAVLNPLQQSQYTVVISAKNDVLYPLVSNASVTVNVIDKNDHKPTFVQATYTYHMAENAKVPVAVGMVSATDRDTGLKGTVTYSFVAPAPAGFSLNSATGALTMTAALDKETTDHVVFWIQATDGAPKPLSDTCTVYVYVDDVNDNVPVFSPKTYTTTASANTSPGTGIVAVRATDADQGVLGTAGLTYSILSGDPQQRFTMTTSGVIEVLHLLSQLTTTKYTLTVQAADSGTPAMTATATVTVNVLPANAKAPVFEHTSYSIVQSDTVQANTVLFTASATGQGAITYSLASSQSPFKINSTNGAVQPKIPLNADHQTVYALSIIATDTLNLMSTMHLTITLTHINEHAPVFNPVNSSASVSEAASIGTSIITVRATDLDTGTDGILSYSFVNNGPFLIDPSSGVIELEQSLDRETRSVYSVVVVAMDQAVPPMDAYSYLTITVGDVNDSPPVFQFPIYNGTVLENQPAGAFAVRPVAMDADLNPTLTYSLTNPNSFFTINPATGAVTTLAPLDREKTSKYDLTVQVSDGIYTALCQVDIEVLDDNDNGPKFSTRLYAATISANADVGTSIAQMDATDVDIGTNGDILYSMPGLVQLQDFIGISATGLVSVTNSPILADTSEFTLMIVATDALNLTLKDTASLQLAITGLELNVVTEAQKVPEKASEFSTPQLIGIIIGGCALLVLIIILILVIRRKPKKQSGGPREFDDAMQFHAGSEQLTHGGGIQNPMYSEGDPAEEVKHNPMYAEGEDDQLYDSVGVFSDKTRVIN